MAIKPDYSGQYLSKKNELIIYEGDRTSSILLLLKGKIEIFLSPFEQFDFSGEPIVNKSCRLFELGQNTFLSVNDIMLEGRNSLSIKSADECNIYCFPADSADSISNLISNQKDYSTYLVSSLATLIDLSYNSYQKLSRISQDIENLTKSLYIYFWAIKDKYYFQHSPDIKNLDNFKEAYEELKESGFNFFPVESDSLTDKSEILNLFKYESELDASKIEYFSRILNIPLNDRKGFFNSESFVCEYHIQKGSELFNSLINEIKTVLLQLNNNINDLFLLPENLFATYGQIAAESKNDIEALLNVLNILKYASDILAQNINILKDEFKLFEAIETSKISDFYENVIADGVITESMLKPENIASGSELPQELRNSLENILMYCSYPQDFIDSFNKKLHHFRSLNDTASNDAGLREIRNSLTTDFFEVYDKAYMRSRTEDYCPKLISMFLNFGYMDERLLTKEQVITLYRLCEKKYPDTRFSFYTAQDWLDSISHNEKVPSINDFGQDYFDVFREMKKRKIVKDSDKAAYDNDTVAKVSFEIKNMLKTNQKVCHGHMSSYFPILHKDNITRDLDKSFVTPSKVQAAIDKVLATDFSAFYREIWYKNDKRGIEKEAIMKEVLPDIIIAPTFGSRASMWQEITGRGRNTPGRFIIPAFTDENLDEMVLKLIGAFRWELCRTMMGVAWNDITDKSLTSEYTDYIQFYKKNHDLTEDAKDKIKVQIQRNRNVLKDIFTSDYETWINYESKGILRLNKVARSILFRYCPLPKEVRNKLSKQPAFTDLATQFNTLRVKTAKSLTCRYTKIFNDSVMDKDMELNLIFYSNM